MHDLAAFFEAAPFAWERAEKTPRLLAALGALRAHHEAACPEYRVLARLLAGTAEPSSVEEAAFLPVRLFKMYRLLSVPPEAVFKTLTSSGTTGQAPSRIVLDKETALAQSRALAHITRDFLGRQRLPLVILDTPSVIKDPAAFSARGAGILGFSVFGRDPFYALDDAMTLNRAGLQDYLQRHRGETILFFGFTFMIWEHFCGAFGPQAPGLDLAGARIIHGGGWKKLRNRAVDNDRFKARLREICGPATRVHNFYGMVEQTGSVCLECEEGRLHASNFSQIVIRDPLSLQPLPAGRPGLIETVSVLPWSYPGQALLTEDVGEWLGEDDCPCGRKGRTFAVHGRLPRSEARGCSDTYAMER
jgi:hypothetical protein